MEPTTVHLDTAFRVGRIDPRLFGGFLEHLGRAVYQGVYDPDSPHADADGFRADVLEALRPLAFTVMRYPGGNFASGYHWEDGVGLRDHRPRVRDLAWQSLEPNRFGTDEFLALCRKLDWIPMLTVNLGTGTPEEARNWVEYCNSPAGSRYADRRVANGHPDPHRVPLWCLGNEMDGAWQIGHVPADQYAVRALQAAKMMRDVDPHIELVVCGSCGTQMPTYMEWDRRVLDYLGDGATYVSLHRYVRKEGNDTADFLAASAGVDRQIEEMDAACRFVQAKRRAPNRPWLCFDEWNVWYKQRGGDGAGRFAPPLLEEVYNLEDALVVAGFLHSFLRHADAVRIANLAQIVNVLAPILTREDELLRQSIYYPLAMIASRRSGLSLQVAVDGPGYESTSYGPVDYIDASAILDERRLHVWLTNRSVDAAAPVRVALADGSVAALANGEMLTGPSPATANSFEHPNVVKSTTFHEVQVSNGSADLVLPPLSFATLTFSLGR